MSSVISPWCTWACTWPPSWRQHMDKGSQVGSFGRCSITHNLAAMAAFLNCGGIDRYANRPFSRTMYWSPTLCFWYNPTLTHVHQIHHHSTIPRPTHSISTPQKIKNKCYTEVLPKWLRMPKRWVNIKCSDTTYEIHPNGDTLAIPPPYEASGFFTTSKPKRHHRCLVLKLSCWHFKKLVSFPTPIGNKQPGSPQTKVKLDTKRGQNGFHGDTSRNWTGLKSLGIWNLRKLLHQRMEASQINGKPQKSYEIVTWSWNCLLLPDKRLKGIFP